MLTKKFRIGEVTILKPLDYIDGYAVIDGLTIINDVEYHVYGLVDIVEGEVVNVKPSCSNLINFGNGVYLQTINMLCDFGKDKGKKWEETSLYRIDRSGISKLIKRYNAPAVLAENTEKKFLIVPSLKDPSKKVLYDVDMYREIGEEFDEIYPFEIDNETYQKS